MSHGCFFRYLKQVLIILSVFVAMKINKDYLCIIFGALLMGLLFGLFGAAVETGNEIVIFLFAVVWLVSAVTVIVSAAVISSPDFNLSTESESSRDTQNLVEL